MVLVFDRQIANAMNQFSVLGESLKKWPNALPPLSSERFENWLRFVRFLGFRDESQWQRAGSSARVWTLGHWTVCRCRAKARRYITRVIVR